MEDDSSPLSEDVDFPDDEERDISIEAIKQHGDLAITYQGESNRFVELGRVDDDATLKEVEAQLQSNRGGEPMTDAIRTQFDPRGRFGELSPQSRRHFRQTTGITAVGSALLCLTFLIVAFQGGVLASVAIAAGIVMGLVAIALGRVWLSLR